MSEEDTKNDSKETKPTEVKSEAAKPAPASPEKKKKGMPTVLKVLLIALVAVTGFIVVVGILFYMNSSGASKASDEFLNALQAGDGNTAYQLLSTDAMEVVPEDDFIAVVDQIGPILNTEERKTSTEVSAETGSDTEAVVVYEIDGTDDVTYVFAITMVKEDGDWKVLNFDSDEKTEGN